MDLGVLNNHAKKIDDFDRTFYQVKPVSGISKEPAPGVHNIVSCFGNNELGKKETELCAVGSGEGEQRLWQCICPSAESYRQELKEYILNLSKQEVAGIHLDCIGLPGPSYCSCSRCQKLWQESGLTWEIWRCKTVTDFIGEVKSILPDTMPLSLSLYPDPVHPERFGLDLKSLEQYADFFLVPLYDMTYKSPYWMEVLANAFRRRLTKPLYVEIYMKGPKEKDLLAAVQAVAAHADGLVFAYDTKLSRELLPQIKMAIENARTL
ncbi:hypothetical protein [Dethiobacter alkaliphilus]|uniref:Uncharacterized protein n=1 Tax=Dethiobacter alkaliphilus AHT 1 TaxID=555088 RepID=C0GK78_DETAL|nr:hypothetical protein [Dethiobacter alkaliphilus]EEG76261.1 conserved hypothetical protein [Dethiobacter alkaliphilus AHT 1]